MRNYSKIYVVIALVCMYVIGFYQQNLPKDSALSVVDPSLQQALAQTDATHEIGVPTKTSDCRVNGPFPDPACTPGAIFPDATKEIICVSGYTKKVRNVSVSTKKKIYAAYNVVYPQATGSYEADHLIPLELGGNNDVVNLFPEAGSPTPGFHEKDLVENYLHQEVCAGRIGLSAAQKQIATDWLAVYNTLTGDQITELRQQFRSWTKKN